MSAFPLLAIGCFAFTLSAFTQNVQEAYGFDQVLVNGVYYENRFWGSMGHPFLVDEELREGSMVFRGKEYHDLALNYNIYEQQVLLYASHGSDVVWVLPPVEYISSFVLGDKYFVRREFNKDPRFFQEVYAADGVACLYYWFKSRQDSDHHQDLFSSKFSDSKKECYLQLDERLLAYRNNRSFVRLFPKDNRARVRNYLKDGQIRVKQCGDQVMQDLMHDCHALL